MTRRRTRSLTIGPVVECDRWMLKKRIWIDKLKRLSDLDQQRKKAQVLRRALDDLALRNTRHQEAQKCLISQVLRFQKERAVQQAVMRRAQDTMKIDGNTRELRLRFNMARYRMQVAIPKWLERVWAQYDRRVQMLGKISDTIHELSLILVACESVLRET